MTKRAAAARPAPVRRNPVCLMNDTEPTRWNESFTGREESQKNRSVVQPDMHDAPFPLSGKPPQVHETPTQNVPLCGAASCAR
jgi:hypothetical protein